MSLAASLDMPSAYERALSYVRSQRHVNPTELARACNIGPAVAKSYLRRMAGENVVGAANGAGRHVVISSLITSIEIVADADANPTDVITSAAGGRLRTLIERIERLEEDKAAIAGDLKEVYAEAKGEGFDTKVMRKIVSLRKKDKIKLQEEEALLDLYLSAIGGL